MASRRRRLSPRPAERPTAPPPSTQLTRTAPSRLAMLLLIAIGYWVGRFASVLPDTELRVADVVVAVLSALALALWYRRQARRVLSERQARRR